MTAVERRSVAAEIDQDTSAEIVRVLDTSYGVYGGEA